MTLIELESRLKSAPNVIIVKIDPETIFLKVMDGVINYIDIKIREWS